MPALLWQGTDLPLLLQSQWGKLYSSLCKHFVSFSERAATCTRSSEVTPPSLWGFDLPGGGHGAWQVALVLGLVRHKAKAPTADRFRCTSTSGTFWEEVGSKRAQDAPVQVNIT